MFGGGDRAPSPAPFAAAGGGSRLRTVRYPWPWVLPVLILVALFTVYPVGYALWTSLHQVLLILPANPFIGIQNYIKVVESPYFWEAVGHTLSFIAVSAPVTTLIAFGVARLLTLRFVGRSVLRAVVILPWVLPGGIAGIVWVWIFHPNWGILNLVLFQIGIIAEYVPWLDEPHLARIAVVSAHIWTQFPFASVLLMAALATIDPALYEAAEIDGAGAWRKLRSITLAQIKPMLLVVVAYQVLTGLTSYDLTYAMTGGGPGTATTLISYHIYKETFVMLNFGNGAALGFLMVLLSLGLIFVILRVIPAGLLEERGR